MFLKGDIMIKNKFLKNTFILLVASLITKGLGFIIRLYITRIIGIEGNSLLSVINPIYSLLTQIATFSFPLTIAKLISERKYQSSKIITNSLYLMIFINIFIILLVGLNSNFIAIHLLKNSQTNYLILALLLTLPFISLSSIIKGYFFGNENMLPYAFSNVLEQIFRLILFNIFLLKINNYNSYYGILFIILLNIFSESFSVLIFMLFIPRRIKLSNIPWNYEHQINKDIVLLSTPSVLSKIIGNIFYFFEPIIIINILINQGLSYGVITANYARYNIYALSIVMLPSFIMGVLEKSLVPELSKLYQLRDKRLFINRIKKSIIVTLIISMVFKVIIDIFGKEILAILYHDTSSYHYLIFINQYFFLYFLEIPLSCSLLALYKNKIIFVSTIVANSIKVILMVILLKMNLFIYALLIAELVNIMLVILMNYLALRKGIKDLF